MPALDRAIAIAVSAHAGQVDKAGQPYILHPLRVMLQVSGLHERMAAVLHDVVEDTDWTLEDLAGEGFPEDVIKALEALTKREGETRSEAAKRAAAHPVARAVKMADVADNMDLGRIDQPSAADFERVKEYGEVLDLLRSHDTGERDLGAQSVEAIELVRTEFKGPTLTRIKVEIAESGDLLFSGQDVGEAPERSFGDEDYEYWLKIDAKDKDRVLLALIEKLHAGNPAAITQFKSFLESKGISSEFFSYV